MGTPYPVPQVSPPQQCWKQSRQPALRICRALGTYRVSLLGRHHRPGISFLPSRTSELRGSWCVAQTRHVALSSCAVLPLVSGPSTDSLRSKPAFPFTLPWGN